MSTPAVGGHPTPEELDLLVEDDASPTPAERRARESAAAHVSGCERCSAVVADLAWVRAMLREEARHTPPPPADLEQRLALALDAERPPAGTPAQAVPLRRTPGRAPRWLAAAAGLVVLGGTATAATQLLGGGDAAETALSGAAEATDQQDQAEGGGESVGELPRAERAPGQDTSGPAPLLATGEDYTTERLDQQVSALLATAASPAARDRVRAASEPLGAPTGLAACLEAIGAPGATPQAVDLSTFEGRAAAVIVLPADAGRSQVWVVRPDCGGGDGQVVHHEVVTP